MDSRHQDSSRFHTLAVLDKTQTRIEKAIVASGLMLATLILFINILYSVFTGSTLPWASEVAQYIMVWVVFIGTSILMRATEHVTMDLITRVLSKKAELYLDIFIYTVVGIFLFYLTYLGSAMTLDVYRTGQSMININISMAWVYLSFPVGVLLMAFNAFKVVAIKLSKVVGGEVN